MAEKHVTQLNVDFLWSEDNAVELRKITHLLNTLLPIKVLNVNTVNVDDEYSDILKGER